MKLRIAPELREGILGALRKRSSVRDNDQLVHVSDLQFCLLKRTLRDLWPTKESDKQTLKYSTGKSVHETLEAIREWRAVVEMPVEKDGIIGTPDIMEDESVVEVKSTWKSMRRFTEDFARAAESYIDQAKTYCSMTGRTKAQIDVLGLCGDYTYPLSPELISAEVEFSVFELNHHWNSVKLRRDRLNQLYVSVMDKMAETATREGEPVPEISLADYMGWSEHPFTSVIGYEWECDHCEYLEQCRPPVIYEEIKRREDEAKFKLENKEQLMAEKLAKKAAKLKLAEERKQIREQKTLERLQKKAEKDQKKLDREKWRSSFDHQ